MLRVIWAQQESPEVRCESEEPLAVLQVFCAAHRIGIPGDRPQDPETFWDLGSSDLSLTWALSR